MTRGDRVPVSLRIERLHECKFIAWQAIIISIAMFAEAVEINSFGFILPIIQEEFELSPTFMGYLGSSSSVGMMIGALCCSFLADRFGRKKLLIGCIALWGSAGILFALSPNPAILFVTRVLFGIGAGAQIPVSLALLSEITPAASRAKYIVLSLVASPLAVWFGATVASFILAVSSWRVMLIVISLLSFWGIVVWKGLHESARWLESKGRFEEADATVDYYEQQVAKSSGKPIIPPAAEEVEAFKQMAATREEATVKVKFSELWKREHYKHSMLGSMWSFLQMLGYFSLASWLTALLVSKGFSVVKSTSMIAIFALGGIPAYFVMVWFLDIAGRKTASIVMALLTAITAYIYGSQNTFAAIVITGFIYQFCQYSYNMCCSTYWPELLPTYIRGTGTGFFQFCGRLGAVLGVILVGYLMSFDGVSQVFYLIMACNVLSVILIVLLGKETKNMIA